MSLFAISDLHLPIGVDKPMDVFGREWDNYVERLKENWQSNVGKDDIVVMPGDFSWATYLEQAIPDFNFVQQLNGKKIILKGNHDYWWETMNKLNNYLDQNNFDSFSILNNNSFEYDDVSICGNRGWTQPQSTLSEDYKIFSREVIRLRLSLESAKNKDNIYVFTHFPPLTVNGGDTPISELMKEFGVKKCFYGHLHAGSKKYACQGTYGGIEYKLVSADGLGFNPYKILD